MLTSSYQYLPTLALLKAVETTLQAVVLPDPYTAMGKAFEEVRVYAHNNIGQALQDLQVVSDRVALVIPAGFAHKNDSRDQVLTSRRTLDLVILVADRVIGGSDNEAAMGGKDNPGMVYLTELAITTLVNAGDFGLGANVCLEPTNGQPILLPFQDKNFGDQVFAREAWGQTYSTPAGEMRVDRGRRRPMGPAPAAAFATTNPS